MKSGTKKVSNKISEDTETSVERITRKVALFVAFCSVFYFFIKLLFL